MGIELNSDDARLRAGESLLRPYKIAKEQGCKFYLGSDAHSPKSLDEAIGFFEKFVDLLDLKESDKFILK